MTTGEACELATDLVHRLRDARTGLAESERMLVAYRSVAQQAIHQLHEQHVEIERLRRQLSHLRDEIRQHRSHPAVERVA